MNKSYITTDFADELYGKSEKKDGVLIKRTRRKVANITWVKIDNDENKYGKPHGNYITIECSDLDDHDLISKIISSNLKRIMKANGFKSKDKILIVGLGNGRFLSDALGPKVLEKINITSHVLAKEKIKGLHDVSCIAPGVMATTGMETSDIIKSLIPVFNIKMLIVIDALATRSVKRLNCAFQISDVGISPGSGINNKRKEITKESMGIPVIALGVATVVDATSIIINALKSIEDDNLMKNSNKIIEHVLKEKSNNLIMTSKEIDRIVNDLSHIIALSINYAINPQLCHNSTRNNISF